MLDENSLEQARLIADKIKSEYRMKLGIRFTLDGEVNVFKKGAIQDDEPLKVVEYTGGELPAPLHVAMGTLYTAVMQIKEKGTRAVPVTRAEMGQFGVERKSLAKLEKLGLIKQRIVKLSKMSGKSQPAQVICYFTDEGRGYVRVYFDAVYARPVEAGCGS
jgi:hypothetical protein